MYRTLLSVLFLTVSSTLFATRSYIELGASTELTEDLTIGLSPEWRYDPDENQTQLHADLSVDYDLNQNWNIGLEYRVGEIESENERVEIDRKLLQTKYTWKIGNFGIQTRLRYTLGNNDSGEEKEYLRYRLKLDYDWESFNLKPFLAYEKYDSLEADFNKNPNVYSAGLSWKINSSQKLNCEYRWVDKLHARNDHGIIKLAYEIKF